MPSTINGIGTHYYGKSNKIARKSICEFCEREATLTSYDTWHCFCFVFIPLIPLGRRRVRDECSACSQHYAIPLKQWRETVENARAEIAHGLAEGSEEEVASAIGEAAALQDVELLDEVTEEAERRKPGSRVVATAMGDAYAYLAQHNHAEMHHRRALELEDTLETREDLARDLLAQKRPEEAFDVIQPMLGQEGTSTIGWNIALGQGFQAKGLHQRAIDHLDAAVALEPSIGEDKEFRKIWKKSAGKVDSVRREASPYASNPKSKTSFVKDILIGKLWWLWLIGLAVGSYAGWSAHLAGNRTLEVINALEVAYAVRIGDELVDLPPQTRRTVTVAEGQLEWQAEGLAPIGEGALRIESTFWGRPLDEREFVLNPDRCALLVLERIPYATNVATAPDGTYKVLAGQAFVSFDDIDFAWKKAPEEIKVDQKSGVTWRKRLDWDPLSPADALSIAASEMDERAFESLLDRYFELVPGDASVLSWMSTSLDPSDVVEKLRTRLGDRPVQVEIHRSYQVMVPVVEPVHDVEAEYAGYLEAEPENAELAYLLGRITSDRARMLDLFELAASADVSHAHAALAYDHWTRGEFEEGLADIERALTLQPGLRRFQELQRDLLLGAGQVEPATRVGRRIAVTHPGDFQAQMNHVMLLARRADPQLQRHRSELLAKLVTDETRSLAPLVHAAVAHAAGDREQYLRHLRLLGEDYGIEIALTEGDLEAASAFLLEREPYAEPIAELVVFGLLADTNRELADQHRERSLDALALGDDGWLQMAEYLSARETPTAEDLKNLEFRPGKAAALFALSRVHTDLREECLRQARLHNYGLEFPSLVLESALGE